MATPSQTPFSASTTDLNDHGGKLSSSEPSVNEKSLSPVPPPPPSTAEPKPSVVLTKTHFMLIMISIWLGNFTAYFNETTATTAQHVIGADFNAPGNQNWIATAYLLGFTVTQTLLGKFADIFGRAQVFNATLVLFLAGTLWCGLAQSMNSLIGARLLQGIGAAGRQTVGTIIIMDLTTPDTRGMWLGAFNLSLSLGVAAGPILGAVLSVDTTWRWMFWITLILIGITFAIGVSSMNYPVPHRKQSVGIIAQLKEVDYVGSIMAVGISSFICIPLEMGNKMFPWKSAPIIVMFLLAGALIPVFVWYEMKIAKQPVVDMSLFAIRNVPIACLISFITGAAYFGAVFFLPRYFIDIKGSALIISGVQMFGIILGLGISSILGANALAKTGQVRLIGVVGSVLYTLGSALMFAVGRGTPAAKVIGYSILQGFGSGILYQPSMVVGPMSVAPHQIAGISGFLSFLRTLGGTFATALYTAIYETSFTSTLQGEIPADLLSQGLGLADDHAQYPQYNNIILNALIKAFHLGSVPGVVMGVVYGVAVIFLKNIDFIPAWKRKQIAAKAAAQAGGKA